jgi:hypothetical protein
MGLEKFLFDVARLMRSADYICTVVSEMLWS